jgi:predicted GNAT family acetyltransferase
MDNTINHKTDQMFYIDNGTTDAFPYLKYEEKENRVLNLVETYVPENMRGEGAAARLVTHALEYAKEEEFKVIPTCSYVQSFIEKHDEYSHLVTRDQ